jgi:hypothetical protein
MEVNMQINPLLFCPSPRDIPHVKKLWSQLPYDKFIVKYTPQYEAYQQAKQFFTDHKEYTHLVVCPDDLEIPPKMIAILIEDIKEKGYDTISGYCNIDESQPDTYAVHPLGIDITAPNPPVTYGSYYMKDVKPVFPTDNDILQVTCSGTACQFISRELFEKISWKGATNGGKGNFDWQLSKDCFKLGIPLYIDTRVLLYHRRLEQYKRIREFKADQDKQSYSLFIKN